MTTKSKTVKKNSGYTFYTRNLDIDKCVSDVAHSLLVYDTLEDVVQGDSDFDSDMGEDVVFEVTITPVHRVQRGGVKLVPYK